MPPSSYRTERFRILWRHIRSEVRRARAGSQLVESPALRPFAAVSATSRSPQKPAARTALLSCCCRMIAAPRRHPIGQWSASQSLFDITDEYDFPDCLTRQIARSRSSPDFADVAGRRRDRLLPLRLRCRGFRAVHATSLVLRCPRRSWESLAAANASTLLQSA
jgi:hypothetical protein